MIDALISGTLSRDPTTRTGPSGKPNTNFLLSVPVGDESPVIVSGIAFADVAEKIARLKKGDALAVVGSLKPSTWTDKASVDQRQGLRRVDRLRAGRIHEPASLLRLSAGGDVTAAELEKKALTPRRIARKLRRINLNLKLQAAIKLGYTREPQWGTVNHFGLFVRHGWLFPMERICEDWILDKHCDKCLVSLYAMSQSRLTELVLEWRNCSALKQ